jgi:hypothetical protein
MERMALPAGVLHRAATAWPERPWNGRRSRALDDPATRERAPSAQRTARAGSPGGPRYHPTSRGCARYSNPARGGLRCSPSAQARGAIKQGPGRASDAGKCPWRCHGSGNALSLAVPVGVPVCSARNERTEIPSIDRSLGGVPGVPGPRARIGVSGSRSVPVLASCARSVDHPERQPGSGGPGSHASSRCPRRSQGDAAAPAGSRPGRGSTGAFARRIVAVPSTKLGHPTVDTVFGADYKQPAQPKDSS